MADMWSRPGALTFSLVFFTVGVILVASAQNITTVCVGLVVYTLGNSGINFCKSFRFLLSYLMNSEWSPSRRYHFSPMASCDPSCHYRSEYHQWFPRWPNCRRSECIRRRERLEMGLWNVRYSCSCLYRSCGDCPVLG